MLTDASGNSASSYNYSAFGATRTSSGSVANEVRFSGERTDTESGLEFLRARTYDPSTGTFLSRDSWGVTPTDGQSLDLYAYTSNNPVNAVDPSGHKSCPVGSQDPLCDSYGPMPNAFREARTQSLQHEVAAKKAYDSQSHCRVVGMAGSRCDAPVNFHVQSKSWSWPTGDDYRSVGPAALTLTHDWTELKVTVSTEAGGGPVDVTGGPKGISGLGINLGGATASYDDGMVKISGESNGVGVGAGPTLDPLPGWETKVAVSSGQKVFWINNAPVIVEVQVIHHHDTTIGPDAAAAVLVVSVAVGFALAGPPGAVVGAGVVVP